MDKNIVEFTGTVEVNPFKSDNFKIYGVKVNEKEYPYLKINKYGNVTIVGNIHELGIGIEYNIKAEEEKSKYGWNYKVINIRRDKPTNFASTRLFLTEILTPTQVDSIMNVYPNIVEKVMKDDLDDIDLSKLYDIGEYRFNVIKRKITENFALSELVEEFKGLISFNTLKKLFDEFHSVKNIKSQIKKEPYLSLMRVDRIAFKSADNILMELDKECKEMKAKGDIPPIDFGFDLKTSKQRCESAMLYLLEENENAGNTKIEVKKLRDEIISLVKECSHHFIDIIKDSDYIFYDKTTQSLSKTETYIKEKYISDKILEGLKSNIVWNYDTEKYRKVDGFELTEEQTGAIRNICIYNISILDGLAGTGKSSSVSAIINMLIDNKKTFQILAPTGKASKCISEFTKQEATTIHRGLGYDPIENEWGFNENYKLKVDVLVVDETSMVDIFLMEKIIKATDLKRTKLLLIGDSAQLPSVGCGNILHDLLNSNIIPRTSLSKPFRYGKGGITTIATNTRNGQKFLEDNGTDKPRIFGEDKAYVFKPTTKSTLIRDLKYIYSNLLQNFSCEDILVLSSYNKGDFGTVAINNILQPMANKNISNNSKYFKAGETTFYEGDLVIQTMNNYKAQVYNEDGIKEDDVTFVCNGEIGKIIKINKDSIIIQFDSLVIYDRDQMQSVKLGYSISVHKSQGSQAKVVVLLTPKSHVFMLNSNLMYVGETRAKQKVYHLGEISTVNTAIKKKAEFKRDTFLKDLLKQAN